MKKIIKLINKKRISLLLTIILGLGISLGAVYFMYYKKDDRLNNLSTGLISLDFKELSNVALTSNVPVIDEVGLRKTPYSFKATNTSAVPLALTIKLDVLEKEKMIPLGAISYGVFINNKKVKKDYIHDDKILYTYENMSVGETIEVKLYFWVDYYYDVPDQDFEATIKVEANNTSSFGEITPLTLSYNTSNVENNKQYIMTSIKNYATNEEKGMNLLTPENLKLEVSGDNIRFTYKDSLGNAETTEQDNLVINYTMNQKLDTNVQIFLSPTTNSNITTDVKIKLTKDGKEYEQVQTVTLVGGQYCKTNGFTKLSDCILVSENFASDVETAKTYIENKGKPDLNKTSPEYTYLQDFTENQTFTGTSGYKWYFGDKYYFDSATGKFTLKKSDGTTNETTQVDLSNDAIDKYTCGTTNFGYQNCQTIYKVESVNTSTRQIMGQRITNKVASSLEGETGLYKDEDDDGKTYYYRGAVTNNNVLFGGYYWKIIRINGDGSIRLIFNGNSTGINNNNASISNSNASGYGSTYAYNPVFGGPTYVGYMYNESEDVWESDPANHTNFAIGKSYYWGNKNDFDVLEDKYGTYFKLKSTYSGEPKTIVEMSNDATQLAATPYTCKEETKVATCRVLYKVESITIGNNNAITTSTKYLTKHPNTSDLSEVNKNNINSNAKNQLEEWYENKFMTKTNNGNPVTDYIVDNTFCNDRSITRTNNYNSGYKLTEHTFFSGKTRLLDNANKEAILKCINVNDKFSTTEKYGNKKLKYPIGLITADEVALAGGKYNENNQDFYLRTNKYFWTMTPSCFESAYTYTVVWRVYPTGLLTHNNVTADSGLRAVINLTPNTLISEGDGSLNNPYQLKL